VAAGAGAPPASRLEMHEWRSVSPGLRARPRQGAGAGLPGGRGLARRVRERVEVLMLQPAQLPSSTLPRVSKGRPLEGSPSPSGEARCVGWHPGSMKLTAPNGRRRAPH